MESSNEYFIRMVYEQYWKERNSTLLSQEERRSRTCRHFGIGRSLFYKWKRRFDETNLSSLEDDSRSPKQKRKRVASLVKDTRILDLRKQYPAYGKEKLRVLYERIHKEPITSWYVQRVIETYSLQGKRSG